MLYQARVPGPPLANHIAMMWYCENPSPPPHRRERVLPSGSMGLIINLHDDVLHGYQAGRGSVRRHGAIVGGARSEYVVIEMSDLVRNMGVSFLPGGAFPFFGAASGELENRDVELEDLWGSSASAELRERLLEAATVEAKFDVLEAALRARLGAIRGAHPAVLFALAEFSRGPYVRSVGEVTEKIGLSAKRFIDVFHEQVGLTPKRYCRLQRFQRVLRTAHRSEAIDWAGVALDAGYFDQSHFIHDFRAFSGISPGAYVEGRTEFQNHVVVD